MTEKREPPEGVVPIASLDGTKGVQPKTQTPPVTPVVEGKKTVAGEQIVLTPAQLAERLQRKEESATAGLLKQLGVENLEDLSKGLAELKALKTAQLTSQEQQALALAEAESNIAALKAQADAASANALEHSLLLKAYELMGKMETPFANQVAALRLTDLTNVAQGGVIDVAALEAAIALTAETYPWALKRGVTTPPSGATTPGVAPQGESDESRHARYFGALGKQGSFFTPGRGGVVTPE